MRSPCCGSSDQRSRLRSLRSTLQRPCRCSRRSRPRPGGRPPPRRAAASACPPAKLGGEVATAGSGPARHRTPPTGCSPPEKMLSWVRSDGSGGENCELAASEQHDRGRPVRRGRQERGAARHLQREVGRPSTSGSWTSNCRATSSESLKRPGDDRQPIETGDAPGCRTVAPRPRGRRSICQVKTRASVSRAAKISSRRRWPPPGSGVRSRSLITSPVGAGVIARTNSSAFLPAADRAARPGGVAL